MLHYHAATGHADESAPTGIPMDTEDDAVSVARRIGFPCVIKPLDGNHGRGVALDLRDEEAVRAAWPETRRCARSRVSGWTGFVRSTRTAASIRTGGRRCSTVPCPHS